MYLATLPPLFSTVSTYFIAAADGVGGGGGCYKCLSKSSSQTSEQKPIVITRAKIRINI